MSISRRDLLRFSAAGAAFASQSGWLDRLAAHAAETGTKPKSCILLWMEGGASHKDTFDLKPGTPRRRRVQADSHLRPRDRDQRAPSQTRPPDAPRGRPPGNEHQPGGPRPGPLLHAHRLS